MNKLSTLAKSQQGKDLLEKAKTIANDPKTREKIDGARDKFSGHVDTAKQKMAEKKAKDAGTGNGAPTYGEETSAANTPKYGEEAPASSTTTADTPPTAPHTDPVDKPNPTYGEEEGDKPLYGEDGPKAA
jgi:hypothetical protein